jgi:predicted ABC-type ATPase
MSDVFALDEQGAQALEAEARANPLDPSKLPPPLWAGTGQQFKRLLSPSASAGRSLLMAGATGAMAIDKAAAAGDWLGEQMLSPEERKLRADIGLKPKPLNATDWYFKNVVEDVGQNAVDHWTPDAQSTGAAANTLGTIFQVAGSIPQIIGTPEVFLTDAALSPGVDVVRQGGSTEAALATSGVSLAANAVGMRLPAAWGNNLATRVATGAGANVAVGGAQNLATQQILEADGLEEYAANYDPLNPQALTLDALMGAAFGWRAHVEARQSPLTPSQRNAVLAANNADHFANTTLPGQPKTPGAAVRHQDALETAIQQVLRGDQVNVTGRVDLEQFTLRPELRALPEPENYDRFRVALESGGVADAAAPTSGAVGVDQFIPSTWRRVVARAQPAWAEGLTDAQLLEARKDPAKSAEMERVLRAENAATLERAGQEPTALNLYAMHHFGGRGVRFAKAAGDTPMEQILTAKQLDANDYLKGKTKDEAIANWTDRARKAGVMLADELDAPNFGLPEAPRTIPDEDPFWQAIPEGQNGRETANIDTPERQALRDQLVEEHFAQAQQRVLGEGERPIAWVMGGGGASGKGTILADLKAQGEVPERGAVHIDPDAIKVGKHGISGIPEYRAMVARGDSRAAAVVHEESSQIAQQVRERAVAGKYDLILDRTLGDPAKGVKELKALKDAGYEVRLFGVTVDPGEAVRRAVKRAKGREGRFVPLDQLLKAHKGFAGAFESYAAMADSARLFDNSGAAYRTVAESTADGLQIVDEQAYNSFRGRSETNAEATTYRGLETAPAGRPAARPDSRGNGEGHRSQGARGTRERSPERLETGDRGTGTPQGEVGLDPQRFPVQGADSTVITERGLRLQVRYAVVDVGKLVTSHDDALAVNPEFPAELQPRDRTRAASEQQITRIANNINPELLAESPKAADGAPIIGQDGVVESGNARTIALRRAYNSGKADDYRAFLLENAARFGLDPAQLDGIAQPVLVRVALGDYDRAEFARQANESTVAGMSATEQAMADAQRLPDMGDLQTNDDGTINMRASAKFVHGFIEGVGPNERGAMSTADGELSQQGQNRIRSAVFARAYGDPELVAMMAEATDANVKNVLAGMLRAAPAIARLREMIAEGGRFGPDITPDLVMAARKFSQLRRDGTTVEQFEAQGDFFGSGGLTPRARDLLRTVGENARAPKRMAEFLQRYVDAVHALGDPRQADLVGGQGGDADAVIGRASEATRAANEQPTPKAGALFGASGRPTQEAAQPVITAENRAAYEAIAAMPDLQVMGEDGVMRPAAEFLAEGDAEAAAATETARAAEAAANCYLRTAA